MSPIDVTSAQDFLHRLYAAVNDHAAEVCCVVLPENTPQQHTLHGSNCVLQLHRDVMLSALRDMHIEPAAPFAVDKPIQTA